MFSTLAVSSFGGPGVGFGFIGLFVLIPLFWIGVAVLIAMLARRRWRAGGHPAFAGSRSAEVTLAERFAQGDIEEKEYRARLEVLRANIARPPR